MGQLTSGGMRDELLMIIPSSQLGLPNIGRRDGDVKQPQTASAGREPTNWQSIRPFHFRVAVGPVPRPPGVRHDIDRVTSPVARPASTSTDCSHRSDPTSQNPRSNVIDPTTPHRLVKGRNRRTDPTSHGPGISKFNRISTWPRTAGNSECWMVGQAGIEPATEGL